MAAVEQGNERECCAFHVSHLHKDEERAEAIELNLSFGHIVYVG